ncbi:hypothetical protein JB92DRAFT_3129545 [Gautieria morchelliformis]|nr:hypothetical protein JB92DRAFT_3129545 [Gautieria morchelliformis]
MSSRPKRKITATEKVTDPSNASVPALASHQAAASAAAAKWLAAARLPSAPSSESIDELAVEGESSGTPQFGDTADPTGTENTPGGEAAKELPGSQTSSRVNKRKTVDILDLTDSDFDEGGKTSDSTGSSKTQHKRKQEHTMKRHKSAADPIDVDAENVLTDINIVDIGATSMKTNRKNANRDLDEFFEDMAELMVWALLAADYLPIMASSVSSERAFSSAGITSANAKVVLRATSLKHFNASTLEDEAEESYGNNEGDMAWHDVDHEKSDGE